MGQKREKDILKSILSIYLSVCVSVCLSIHLSIWLFIFASSNLQSWHRIRIISFLTQCLEQKSGAAVHTSCWVHVVWHGFVVWKEKTNFFLSDFLNVTFWKKKLQLFLQWPCCWHQCPHQCQLPMNLVSRWGRGRSQTSFVLYLLCFYTWGLCVRSYYLVFIILFFYLLGF